MSHMIERRKLRLMFLCGAALFSCVGCSLGRTAPELSVKAVSDSPDGKYRCVIKEQLPAKGYYSPHIYTFAIIDTVTGRDLKGEQLKDDTDSVSLPDLKIEWAGNELKVRSTDPPGYVFAAKINNNEQMWTVVRK
jgi:hypothetical protein